MSISHTAVDSSPTEPPAPGTREAHVERVILRCTNRRAALVTLAVLVLAGVGLIIAYRSTSPTDRLGVIPCAALTFLTLSAVQVQAVIALLRDRRVLPVLAAAIGSSLWVAAVYLATDMSARASVVGLVALAVLGTGLLVTPREARPARP
ncbi:hypothetical protein GCM10009624_35290 [Gordonia sinesedis]